MSAIVVSLVLANTGRTPEPWLAGLGCWPSKARVEASVATGGGLGVFATEALMPGEELCSIPLAACLSVNDAAEYTDAVLGSSLGSRLAEVSEDGPGRESLLVAALLAYTKWGPEDSPARVRWGGYVDSLPWATAEDVAFERAESFVRDAEARRADVQLMKSHGTLSVPPRGEDLSESVSRWRRMHTIQARFAAESVQQCLGGRLPLEACWAALWLVESRCFDLSARGGDSCVLVPWLDCTNHPSATALRASGPAGARFASTPHVHSRAVVGCVVDRARQAVLVRAPSGLEVRAGDELWNWYSFAGHNAGSVEEWAQDEAMFVAQYGFSPWD